MKTFSELNVSSPLLKAVEDLGYIEPMPVQEQVIPLMLNSRQDIIALAQTGSGKTAAFGLPLIQQTDLPRRETQALILCPTRELCLQISNAMIDFAQHIPELRIVPVYGGASINEQISQLRRGAHIIVATPGRLIDLLERGAADIGHVERLVLDEADEMLNMGFKDSIEEILSRVPQKHNTLLFSATMPDEIARLTKKYMNSPLEIVIGGKNEGADNIKHLCFTVGVKDKYLALKRVADFYPDIYGIVFCRTRRETQEVADKLIHDGYNAESLHGDLSQTQREFVMQKFRIRNIQLLVATDVAARGIDVHDLTHIINYSLPEDPDIYTHRSGRTGRAGKAGISISFANKKEKQLLKLIEKRVNKEFIHAKIPGGREVCEKQLFHLINKIETVEIDNVEIEPFLPALFKKLDWFEKEELIKRLVSVEFNRFLKYYKDAPDLNNREDHSEKTSSKGAPRIAAQGFTPLYINFGKIDGLQPAELISMLNDNIKGPKVEVGSITIQKKHTIFEVEESAVRNVLKTFSGAFIDNRKVIVKIDEGELGGEKHRRSHGDSGSKFKHNKRSDNPRNFSPKDRKKKYKKK